MIGLIDIGELVGMLLLAGLVIFILWESFRREKPTSPDTPAVPGQTATELGLLIGAGVFAVMGVFVLLDPAYEHVTGRRAFFWNTLYDAFGKPGVAAVIWVVALLMLGVWHVRRTARRNAPQKQAHSGR